MAGKSNGEENCVRFSTWTPQLGIANAWPSQRLPKATVLCCSIIRILIFGQPSLRCRSSIKTCQYNCSKSLLYSISHSCFQLHSIFLPEEATTSTTIACFPISRGKQSSCGLPNSLYILNAFLTIEKCKEWTIPGIYDEPMLHHVGHIWIKKWSFPFPLHLSSIMSLLKLSFLPCLWWDLPKLLVCNYTVKNLVLIDIQWSCTIVSFIVVCRELWTLMVPFDTSFFIC